MEKEFIKHYNNMDLTVYDIKMKCGLNNHNYKKIRDNLIEKGEIEPVRHVNYTAKYTTKLANGDVIVRKSINKKRQYLGVYPNQTNADMAVKELRKHNWEINKAKPFISKLQKPKKHYVEINGRFYPCKTVEGKRVYYDSFADELDAVKCVELLDTINWDKQIYEKQKGGIIL